MYERLERLREEVKRCEKRFQDAQEKLRVARERLKDCEASQILSDVGALNLTPEELAKVLAVVKSGQLSDLISGHKEDGETDEKEDSDRGESDNDKKLSKNTEEVTDTANPEGLNGQNDVDESSSEESDYLDVLNSSAYDTSYEEGYGGYKG
ncbi:hypothetical protein UYO_2560 [Lachnospiraceae bacterium JC7]|nr:hypothetical protein UYO_2560 [Lachnospiraceae bacterium JC7]